MTTETATFLLRFLDRLHQGRLAGEMRARGDLQGEGSSLPCTRPEDRTGSRHIATGDAKGKGGIVVPIPESIRDRIRGITAWQAGQEEQQKQAEHNCSLRRHGGVLSSYARVASCRVAL
jgi:hypothetical protein